MSKQSGLRHAEKELKSKPSYSSIRIRVDEKDGEDPVTGLTREKGSIPGRLKRRNAEIADGAEANVKLRALTQAENLT